MQSSPTNSFYEVPTNRQFTQTADSALPAIATDSPAVEETHPTATHPTVFRSHFVDQMEMGAAAQTVITYLDAHSEWFHRCAHPMQVESIGTNSYALIIGHFGAFGYDIEPKVGLNLLPQQKGVYRIETVPVPGYAVTGYDVDFRAAMQLIEFSSGASPTAQATRIQWQLDLTVSIQFPKFIHALPDALIQRTGDRLLNQIVRQVSRRLTHKVQEDFHSSHQLPLPKRDRTRR
ncbi:DUF1997 domain-containing protein [Myxacorys almedinensis]|uniref:DUF1997 domain-containing protein n=1 Tax=Myxacorys almedinensis A TaxID=2690445 RepID=A0A8J7YYV7_9CYAN|nr:DUF1997 domain-containing protein [Myxacorys almedinensis]NDJ17127.1 DUF1997 domain-containing protein [Myxacorys almedinensis A]